MKKQGAQVRPIASQGELDEHRKNIIFFCSLDSSQIGRQRSIEQEEAFRQRGKHILASKIYKTLQNY
jgi:hypothetical protein